MRKGYSWRVRIGSALPQPRNPELTTIWRDVGTDRLVVAIDVDRSDVTLGYVYIDGGRNRHRVDARAWAQEAARRAPNDSAHK